MQVNPGHEPFIFISYAHRDSAVVLPVIDRMKDAGYHVWFDNGIEAGTEWPQYIAEQLAASSCVMIFMSANTAESHNCRNEINLAHELKKDLFVVHLEDFEMPLGLRLQLNLSQAIYRSRFKSDTAFADELIKARIIRPYRALPTEEPVVEVSPAPAVAAESVAVAEAAEQAPNKKAKPKKQKKETQPKKPSRFFAWAGIVLASIAVLCIALHLLTTVSIGGERVRKNTNYLYFHNEILTEQDFAKIARLKRLNHLTCSGTALDNADVVSISRLIQLERLCLEGNPEITDISPLANLSALTDLEVGYTSVADISCLSALTNLAKLDISGTTVSDVSVLKELTELKSLYMDELTKLDEDTIVVPESLTIFCCSNSGLTNIDFLSNCQELTGVGVANNQLQALDALLKKPLHELRASGNEIVDIHPLRDNYELTILDLSNNQIENITPLADCFRITDLNLSGNQISDLTPLVTVDNLKYLDLSFNQISDLAPLAENEKFVRNAEELKLQGNLIADISALSAFQTCKRIYLFYNQIENIAPLAKCAMLEILDISNNNVHRLDPLSQAPALKILYAADNYIANIENLTLSGNNTTLSLTYTEEIDWAAAKDRFSNIQVYNIPPRQEDAMSALGYRTDFKSEPTKPVVPVEQPENATSAETTDSSEQTSGWHFDFDTDVIPMKPIQLP